MKNLFDSHYTLMNIPLRRHAPAGFLGRQYAQLLPRQSICSKSRGKPYRSTAILLPLHPLKAPNSRRLSLYQWNTVLNGQRRSFTLSPAAAQSYNSTTANTQPLPDGALEQYERWTAQGRLKQDPHQRSIVEILQNLQGELKNYKPPKVAHPVLGASLQPQRTSMLDAIFRRGPVPQPTTSLPKDIPRGLYLYGDVGSGKTMLMDMFYQTLPANINAKCRIHFHHFMQDVHKRLHSLKMKYGNEFDAMPFVGADLAEQGSVLCFDEFQCTDVADAMILRRLLEFLMSHGTVLVCTSNRHPNDLYKNGIQRESFLPCIALLNSRLQVINLDSQTDYRRLRRPSSSVYHYPLDEAAKSHVQKWFSYLGDPKDPSHPASHTVWGREVKVPAASGKAAMFSFKDLCEQPLSAADYLELTKQYDAFVVTDIPKMDHKTRDLARRFITFVDAVYESRAKLVLTLASSPSTLFLNKGISLSASSSDEGEGEELDSAYRSLMDDLNLNMRMLKNSSIFTGDEERFAFARALSRLSEMEGVEWVGRTES